MDVQKTRVDVLMVDRGLVESRSHAQRLVMAGQVRANGQVVLKPSTKVPLDAKVEVDKGPAYVSRGGEKLEAALNGLSLDVAGLVCADVGASTGGFTDCLLQHNAARVYAIDVGKGILHWKLRQDPRVIVMEETNARYVDRLPESVGIVTIDASFISLKLLLPVVRGWFESLPQGQSTESDLDAALLVVPSNLVIALIKPQFEAGRKEVARGDGVIRDPSVHRRVLGDLLLFAQGAGYGVTGLVRSPITGPKGNVEFLAVLVYPGSSRDLEHLIDGVLQPEQTKP